MRKRGPKQPPAKVTRKVKANTIPGTFDDKKKALFLAAYSAGMTIRQAAKKAGTTTMTISNHTRSDPEFKKAYDEAMEHNTNALEDIVHNMATVGRDKVCCFFLLKARRPHIYRDNVSVQHSASEELVAAFASAMTRISSRHAG